MSRILCQLLTLLLVVCLAPCVWAPGARAAAVLDAQSIQRPIFDSERLQLTADYALRHYGVATTRLDRPQLIVVHFTTIPTLEKSLRFFTPIHIDPTLRHDIAYGGEVNVSAHYLIDRDGTSYQLAAEDLLCRHVIGFNRCAIGIENVAANARDLTPVQAETSAALISRIVARHPSIRYLIGHHEYRDRTLPHYRLFQEDDRGYRFTAKVDPGEAFMGEVRRLLRERYGIRLER